jgi:hypothetical protein
MLSALQYVHNAGIIHGDISMANILIADFFQDDQLVSSCLTKDISIE